MPTKTLFIYFVTIIISFVLLASPHRGNSFEYGSIRDALPTSNAVSPDQFFGQLPKPVTDFVNSAKQIGGDLTLKGSSLDLKTVSPGNLWNDANSWLERNVGVNLTQIIKGIGNIIVWVLSFILNIFKWGLSFIK